MSAKIAMADVVEPVDWISTGIPSLNAILGGGIPFKRITEISGPFSVGKTTLALTTVAQAQKDGYKALWVDQEWSFEKEYPARLGVDLSRLGLVQERYAETAIDTIEEYAEENKNSLIVLDAIGALLPKNEAEKDSLGKTIGGQAGLVAKFCRKIVPLLHLNNHALIVLNHEFTDIMSGRIMTSGGKKLEHHKAIWLKLRKASKNIMQGENKVGEIIEAEVRKNKLTGTMRQTCEMSMLFGQGFSVEADLLASLLASGEVHKKGNTYFRGETKLGVGQAAARAALKV